MVAKTAKTRKAKGTKCENMVAERYRYYKVDETARRMPGSGAFSHFKSDIHKRNDTEYVDEVKNHETVNLRKFWEQTCSQCPIYKTPVLHVSSNFRPIVTILREADFDAISGDDSRRFEIVDITAKKRWNFWEYAKLCHDLVPRATVVYCTLQDEALVIMTINTYMELRKEVIDLESS